MIGNGSTLKVTDNSGARVVQCINQTGTSFGVGDLITVAVKKAIKGKVAAGTVSISLAANASTVCRKHYLHYNQTRSDMPIMLVLVLVRGRILDL